MRYPPRVKKSHAQLGRFFNASIAPLMCTHTIPTFSKLSSAIFAHSTGHRGAWGSEFMEFEFRPDCRLRYANDSHYKGEGMIRKETWVSHAVLDEVGHLRILRILCNQTIGSVSVS